MLSFLNNREHSNFPVNAQADQVELISARSTNKHTIAQTPSSTRVTYLIKLNATSEILAAAHGNHSIGIYQANTGRLVAQCVGHFHPSDPYLLSSGCLDGSLKLWDLKEISNEIENPSRDYDDPVTIGPCQSWQHFGAVSSIDFHPHRKLLVAVHTFDIVFYDLVSKRPITVWRFAKDHSRVRWVKFNKSGSALYTATANKIIDKSYDIDFPLVKERIGREKVLSHLLSDLKFLDKLSFCQSCLVKILLWASCLSINDYRTGQMDLISSYEKLSKWLKDNDIPSGVDLLRQFMENSESTSANMNPLSVIVLEELNEDFKRIEDMNENERFYLWSHRQLMRFSLCRCCLEKIWNYVNSFIDWGFEAKVNDCYGIPRNSQHCINNPTTTITDNHNYRSRSQHPDDESINRRDISQLQDFLSNAHLVTSITFNAYEIFSGLFDHTHCPLMMMHERDEHAQQKVTQQHDSNIEVGNSNNIPLASFDYSIASCCQPFKKPRLTTSDSICNAFDSYNFDRTTNNDVNPPSPLSNNNSNNNSTLVDPINIMKQFQNIESPSTRPSQIPRIVDINMGHYQRLLRNGPINESLGKFRKLSDGYMKLQEILCPAKKELSKPFDERLSVSESTISSTLSTNYVMNTGQRVINDRLSHVLTEEHGSVAQTYSDMTYRVCRWELDYKEINREISFQDILLNCHNDKGVKHVNHSHMHVTYKSNALVIQNSRIFNDSSLRLSSCGKYLAALVTLNEKNIYEKQYLSATMDTFVAVFRTEPIDQRGKCIYGRRFGPLNSPVCLDFSPSAQHLVVGFATQHPERDGDESGILDLENVNPIGRIFRLNSKLTKDKIIERNLAEAGFIVHPSMADCFISYPETDPTPTHNSMYISNLKNYFESLVMNPMYLSMNSIVWKADGGLIYGTTKGLVLLVGNESAAGAISLNSIKRNHLNKIVALDSVEKNSNLIFREDPSDEKNNKRREISTHQSFFSKFATVIQQEEASSSCHLLITA